MIVFIIRQSADYYVDESEERFLHLSSFFLFISIIIQLPSLVVF